MEMPSMSRGKHLRGLWKVSEQTKEAPATGTGANRACKPLGFSEVVDDQGHLLGCVRLSVSCHAAGPEGNSQIRTSTDPEVQVTQRTAGCLRFGEVEHRQLGLPIGTDFEFFQLS